jgi:hypothetical protein
MFDKNIIAVLVQYGSSFLSEFIRNRPIQATLPEFQERPSRDSGDGQTRVTVTVEPESEVSYKSYKNQSQQDYSFECCSKHLSTTLGILKEAIDRAVASRTIDPGVVDKVREAMVSLNAMEPDIANMIGMPEIASEVAVLQKGHRAFRKSMWESKLEIGGIGNFEEDLKNLNAAWIWIKEMLVQTYEFTKQHQGKSCQRVL